MQVAKKCMFKTWVMFGIRSFGIFPFIGQLCVSKKKWKIPWNRYQMIETFVGPALRSEDPAWGRWAVGVRGGGGHEVRQERPHPCPSGVEERDRASEDSGDGRVNSCTGPGTRTAVCTLHSDQNIVSNVLDIADHLVVHRSLYNVHFTLYSVHCTLYTVHCTLYTVHCTLYTVHCTL